MDSAIMVYLVVIVAGIGGAGVVASGGGGSGYPTDDQPLPRRCPYCPIIFGAVLAVIIWMLVAGMAEGPGVLVPALLTGLAAGAAGATVSKMVIR